MSAVQQPTKENTTRVVHQLNLCKNPTASLYGWVRTPTCGRRRPIQTIQTTTRGIGITTTATGTTTIGTTITVAWRCGLYGGYPRESKS